MARESFRGPTYDLETVKGLIRRGACTITEFASRKAWNEGFAVDEAYEVVLKLSIANFHKTTEAVKLPGSFQDVYHYVDASCDLYVKIQIIEEEGTPKARLIDFKKWGAA